jgi:hypothetical protein
MILAVAVIAVIVAGWFALLLLLVIALARMRR